jgi:hypothetical protein
VWDNKVFQFQALPFGLAIAPLVFTKIVQVVSAHLHTLSIQIHSYLDDSQYRSPDGPVGLHFEMGDHKVSIQNRKVYNWSHSPLFLGDQEETGIKSWTQGRSWGDQQVHQGFYTPRNLVDIARFNRCLFPLPYFCGFQEIPSLRVGQQSFSVPRRDGNKILDPGKKLEPVLLLLSATEQTLPLTDVDVCEDPKRLKREWEKGERLFIANSMPILLKHLMLRSLVLRVLRSLVLGLRSLPPRTLSTTQEGRELPLPTKKRREYNPGPREEVGTCSIAAFCNRTDTSSDRRRCL